MKPPVILLQIGVDCESGSFLCQGPADLPGVSTQIENSPNHCDRSLFDPVVDGIRKSLGQEAMAAEDLWMNPGVQGQRIDIGEQRVEEVLTQSFPLSLIEQTALMQIFHR
jgi:hypothetical protein